MARQRKSHEERRDEIIRGALDLAGESGVKDVTAQAIADRIGIAQPTIFRHFKTRDAIFRSVIEWIAHRLFSALENLGGSKAPADVRLRKLLQRQLSFINKHRGLPRLLFSDRLHLEDPELKATVRKIIERYLRHLEVILQNGVDTGLFRAEIKPDVTARWIASAIQGLVMRWSIYDFSFPLEDEAESLWQFLQPVLMDSKEQAS